jgi:transcription initiation factor TFIIH subunit 3
MAQFNDLDASIYVVIVDVHPELWRLRSAVGGETLSRFEDVVRSAIVFTNAYLLMHRENKVCVIANHPGGSEVVYPSGGVVGADTMVPASHVLCGLITDELVRIRNKKIPESESESDMKKESLSPGLPQALSMALCVINRQLQMNPNLQPRVINMQLAKDQSPSYSPIMNCIFSAQKLNVQIDAVIFGRSDSPFMQQACFLTGGVYLRPEDQRSHLQRMLTHSLPSNASRVLLRNPPQRSIDFRASCFCHGKPLEFAFMCSVCLSLLCEPVAVCDTPVRQPR